MGNTLCTFDLVSDRCIDRRPCKNKYPGDRLLVISTRVYLPLHEINILVWMSDKQIPVLGTQVTAGGYIQFSPNQLTPFSCRRRAGDEAALPRQLVTYQNFIYVIR